MPPRNKNAGPTPVESIRHDDKRTNIPTADAADIYGYEADVRRAVYERDATLDPQLVWRGKPELDETDLYVDAPPIYCQEKINPRALVENLRKTAKEGEQEPELLMFEGFDGLDELQAVEFYTHDANWSNRMILGDSLQVMASLAERESLRGKVQMIYIDPPYGIKFGSNWQASARKRDVKDGKLEDAAREAEQIKAFRDTWELGIHSYLAYLRDRMLAARDLLTDSGSVFVQIGDENVHLVRSLMDEVFGSENFCREIVVAKTAGLGSDFLPASVDFILWYAKRREDVKSHALHSPKVRNEDDDAVYRYRDEDDRLYRIDNLTSANNNVQSCLYTYRVGDQEYRPAPTAQWKTTEPGMRRLEWSGRLQAGRGLYYRRYLDDFPVKPMNNLWPDTGSGGFVDDKYYVVQTNTKIIERCIQLCSDTGDLVLDPTCGSGSTAFSAEKWGRRWITIDTSRVALALARQRLMGARYPYYFVADTPEGRAKEQEVSGKPLPPAGTKGDIRQGFVYERVQHITLKSIANNPDIREGMTREEIDAAIKRHADYEVLYNKPYEDKSKVRVTGPFTVESLSPHRALAFDPRDHEANRETISEQAAAEDAMSATFEQSILDNLRKAGIQNGRRNERITFASLDTYPGTYLQAVGEQLGESDDVPSPRVGIAIGPQYGTVSPAFIKAAAREAIAEGSIDLVAVLAFAFDARATEATAADGVTVEPSTEGFATVAGSHKLGRIPVLLVRMNADLLMGEDLKKTGAGNLFTVFGEPDIDVRRDDAGQAVVEIKGVDVFDPTTGEVRSNDTGQIALWMIDTNYNEEAFFVRHCYFTGGGDPYKRLKTALKADIDAEAWESLYRVESRPFDVPETGKIAVKVINDYGDEVMKVFEVT
ncbi:MAG TPA: site-specific DNA-methyltransferase [Mycobacteriales bacterium]|nr:site-specific DNA-methyltransferase [Mycobacteriales bacterium]